MFWLLLVLQILSGLVAGESAIRKYPEGQEALNKLSHSGLFFLQWRAYADYKKDLKYLRNIFGIMALIFGTLFLLLGSSKEPTLFNAIPGLFIVLWLTMQFGTDFKKSIKEQLSIVGLLVIGPWLVLAIDYMTNFQFDHLRLMASPFNAFGIQSLATYQIAIVLSLLGGVAGFFMAIFSIIVFSMVPLFFLFLIVLLSIASKWALNIKPRKAYYIAIVYCYIVGPVLMALESKGFI